MRQKLLLFISMILLFTLNAQAESDVNLPALPMDSTIGATDKKNDSDLSFWQKTKGFFGFGNEENLDDEPENNVQEDDLNTDLILDISDITSVSNFDPEMYKKFQEQVPA